MSHGADCMKCGKVICGHSEDEKDGYSSDESLKTYQKAYVDGIQTLNDATDTKHPLWIQLTEMQEALTHLTAKCAAYEKALEFYADLKNKVHVAKIAENEDEEIGNFVMPIEDHEFFVGTEYQGEKYYGYTSGKLARETLKAHKGVGNG
jgi:hypothetical protein